ncbi:MAG: 2-amino-4-hydroxy-6-hydroxymethyldihydropteridine diphosphokinase [Lachnospiraceae bacterium]|nr:2-amino-4-hydroxy-6-hydroxymethyldihydropteridine diphosphokinase [Lachnospiraceae bacterium]
MYSEWAQDEIHIDQLEIFAHHGVYPEETRDGQTFYVNGILYLDIHGAGDADALDKTVNYGEVCHFIDGWMRENTCLLLEAVAERLSAALLLRYGILSGVDLEIVKPSAPIGLPFGAVSVKICRRWHKAYLAIGSNLGDRREYMTYGVEALADRREIVVKQVSEFIVTKPYGGVEQEDFLNGALEIETILGPEELLQVLHEIEQGAGRERLVHWGPRTLDLDLLFYDRLCYQSHDLVIPHPDLENREFVLRPLSAIAPYWRHPATGKTVKNLLDELGQNP